MTFVADRQQTTLQTFFYRLVILIQTAIKYNKTIILGLFEPKLFVCKSDRLHVY